MSIQEDPPGLSNGAVVKWRVEQLEKKIDGLVDAVAEIQKTNTRFEYMEKRVGRVEALCYGVVGVFALGSLGIIFANSGLPTP